ncbi:Serine/threonine-protein kinase plk4 [Gonapodya sp. JEL0774]|nr:Serine/threonine-protein kinase plk4 [Gonapodya sp. JEL0774]
MASEAAKTSRRSSGQSETVERWTSLGQGSSKGGRGLGSFGGVERRTGTGEGIGMSVKAGASASRAGNGLRAPTERTLLDEVFEIGDIEIARGSFGSVRTCKMLGNLSKGVQIGRKTSRGGNLGVGSEGDTYDHVDKDMEWRTKMLACKSINHPRNDSLQHATPSANLASSVSPVFPASLPSPSSRASPSPPTFKLLCRLPLPPPSLPQIYPSSPSHTVVQNPSARLLLSLLTEAFVPLALSHPNLLPTRYITRDAGATHIISDWLEGPTLADWVRRGWPISETLGLSSTPKARDRRDKRDRVDTDGLIRAEAAVEKRAREEKEREKLVGRVWRECLEAVAHLHHHGIAHRDIKLANFVLCRSTYHSPSPTSLFAVPRVVLLDFGSATLQPSDHRRCGTLSYMAPEVLRGGLLPPRTPCSATLSSISHSPSAFSLLLPYQSLPPDVWSLGIVLHALWYGSTPWPEEGVSARERLKRMMSASEGRTWERRGDAKSIPHLLSHLLQPDPSLRPTCDQLLTYPNPYILDDTEFARGFWGGGVQGSQVSSCITAEPVVANQNPSWRPSFGSASATSPATVALLSETATARTRLGKRNREATKESLRAVFRRIFGKNGASGCPRLGRKGQGQPCLDNSVAQHGLPRSASDVDSLAFVDVSKSTSFDNDLEHKGNIVQVKILQMHDALHSHDQPGPSDSNDYLHKPSCAADIDATATTDSDAATASVSGSFGDFDFSREEDGSGAPVSPASFSVHHGSGGEDGVDGQGTDMTERTSSDGEGGMRLFALDGDTEAGTEGAVDSADERFQRDIGAISVKNNSGAKIHLKGRYELFGEFGIEEGGRRNMCAPSISTVAEVDEMEGGYCSGFDETPRQLLAGEDVQMGIQIVAPKRIADVGRDTMMSVGSVATVAETLGCSPAKFGVARAPFEVELVGNRVEDMGIVDSVEDNDDASLPAVEVDRDLNLGFACDNPLQVLRRVVTTGATLHKSSSTSAIKGSHPALACDDSTEELTLRLVRSSSDPVLSYSMQGADVEAGVLQKIKQGIAPKAPLPISWSEIWEQCQQASGARRRRSGRRWGSRGSSDSGETDTSSMVYEAPQPQVPVHQTQVDLEKLRSFGAMPVEEQARRLARWIDARMEKVNPDGRYKGNLTGWVESVLGKSETLDNSISDDWPCEVAPDPVNIEETRRDSKGKEHAVIRDRSRDTKHAEGRWWWK